MDRERSGELADHRVLLIGGAGFIGHHLALRLKREGADVHIVDSLAVNNLLDAERLRTTANAAADVAVLRRRLALLEEADVPLHLLDARDHGAMARMFGELCPQTVMHLAGLAHAIHANRDPFRAFEHGLRTLATALELSRGAVERFVFLSSSMVYGHFESPVATEEHPLRPIDAYGGLKLCGEEMVRAHQRVAGLACTIVRPCALYGPRCISRRVTQRFVESALAGLPIVIEGDGTDRIDFTYVDDLVDGLVLVLTSSVAENETFNLTSGNARSLLDLARIVQRLVPGATIERAERDRLLPVRGTLSVEKARRLLGYAPAVSLEEGIARCTEALSRTPELEPILVRAS